jgi:endonuclease YncB( thermonuclease family)
MVEQGWAAAFRKYSLDYVDAENDPARGIWRGEFDMPWEWRAARRKP